MVTTHFVGVGPWSSSGNEAEPAGVSERVRELLGRVVVFAPRKEPLPDTIYRKPGF